MSDDRTEAEDGATDENAGSGDVEGYVEEVENDPSANPDDPDLKRVKGG